MNKHIFNYIILGCLLFNGSPLLLGQINCTSRLEFAKYVYENKLSDSAQQAIDTLNFCKNDKKVGLEALKLITDLYFYLENDYQAEFAYYNYLSYAQKEKKFESAIINSVINNPKYQELFESSKK